MSLRHTTGTKEQPSGAPERPKTVPQPSRNPNTSHRSQAFLSTLPPAVPSHTTPRSRDFNNYGLSNHKNPLFKVYSPADTQTATPNQAPTQPPNLHLPPINAGSQDAAEIPPIAWDYLLNARSQMLREVLQTPVRDEDAAGEKPREKVTPGRDAETKGAWEMSEKDKEWMESRWIQDPKV